MNFDIDETVHPQLLGLAWLLGTWEGEGNGAWPGLGEFHFGQRVDFSSNGGPFLHYLSQTYWLDDDNHPVRPFTMETGFWFPHDDASLDVVLADADGWVENYTGNIQGAKIELTTDIVARIKSAQEPYSGGSRLYGNVDGQLMWTWDAATTDVPLQPFMWATLRRTAVEVGEPAGAEDAGTGKTA